MERPVGRALAPTRNVWASAINENIFMIQNIDFKVLILIALGSGCSTTSSIWRGENGQAVVFTFRHAYANTHVLKLDEKSFMMIDSGGFEQAPDLEQDLKDNHIEPSLIKAIILTHGHWDHAAGAKFFQDKYQIPIIAGARDRPLLEKGKSDPLCPTSIMARLRVKDDEGMIFKAPLISRWIEEKTNLKDLIGFDVNIVPIPSHTEGSLIVMVGENAFVGDLFRGAIVGGTPEIHFYMCDLGANREFVNTFLRDEGKEVNHFFTGHFGPVFDRIEVQKAFSINQ
ncbi:MAG: MBL fold metallo-hydrolase [Proteobacteria bacterium]|nr:MBL fold metallo-hydrolase [Pseudomonadota bacterium]